MSENNKEIVVLGEAEHIRLRPTIYVGSVKPTEEKVPVIRLNRIVIEEKSISVGMYKILNEAIDNAVDEAKRMKGKMDNITISVNSKTNEIRVKDTGNGFHKGTSIHKVTGKTNIETAVSQLRSGSNFDNDGKEEALIGTNGLGIKLTNVFSKRFKIITVNETHYFEKEWVNFEPQDSKAVIRKISPSDKKGTEIIFEPLPEIFTRCKWDLDILRSSIVFKKRITTKDPAIRNLKIYLYWDDKLVDTDITPFPADSFSIETPIGEIVIWEKYEDSGSISFVNSAMCSGIHQKIVNDYINENLEDTLGHHFYDVFMSINLPPKIVKFADQNKTRFVTPRDEVESFIKNGILDKFSKFFNTDLYKRIKKAVDTRKKEAELKKIRRDKKNIKVKHSNKYFPSASSKAETLFIVEGLCIDENEKINIWREGDLIETTLKDVIVGDEVVTHANRIRKIVNKQRKLKECVSIKLSDGTIIKQPKTHQYYTYNKITKDFLFKRIDQIDISQDFLVKSNLGSFIGTLEVVDFAKSDDKEYPNIIFLEDNSRYQFSDTHKYCVYDIKSLEFNMKLGKDISIGNLICVFDF